MFVSAGNKSSLLKPEVKDKLLLLWKQELGPHIGFDHVICSKHVYEIQSSDDSQVLMFFSKHVMLIHKIKHCCHHIFSLMLQNEIKTTKVLETGLSNGNFNTVADISTML